MQSYYPLPPNFKSTKFSDIKIFSSITVLNFPTNFLQKNHNNINCHKSIFYYAYVLEKNYWKKIKKIECKFRKYIEFSRKNLNIDDEILCVIFPSSEDNLPFKTKILPDAIGLKVDHSPIAERATYSFNLLGNSSSYQGEYPLQMSSIKNGSFFSFDSLRCDDLKNSEAFVLMMNLYKDASLVKENKISFKSFKNRNLIDEISFFTNSFKCVNLTKINSFKNDLIILTCNSSLLIPIFITINKIDKTDNYEICLEHTHPPSEFFGGYCKSSFAKELKERCLN